MIAIERGMRLANKNERQAAKRAVDLGQHGQWNEDLI